jgi:hypothetical protein
LNLAAPAVTHHKGVSGQEEHMKIALLVLLGLALGALGGAALGIGGALLFGVIAIRDAEIAIEREPVRHRDR